jgi:hypothetical protein
MFHGITVALQRCDGFLLHHSQRRQSSTAAIENMRGVAPGDGFGHRAAAGIADAKEEDAALSLVVCLRGLVGGGHYFFCELSVIFY